MSSISSISSNFFKKTIPIYTSNPFKIRPSNTISMNKLRIATYRSLSYTFISSRVMGMTRYSSDLPRKSPPEIPTAPPFHNPAVPTELPRMPNIPDFDPIPPEKPSDPPPLSPGPNPGPEFPGPPDPGPEVPGPTYPGPEMPSPPGEPEVIPPHGPEVIPLKPTEPGPPSPTQPDIPTPLMGCNGLLFY